MHDYSEHLPKPTTEFQGKMNELVTRLMHARQMVATKEEELKVEQKLLTELEQKELPELMDSMGLTEFRCANGLQVKLEEDCKVSIPLAERARAYQWMDSNGFGDLIKRAFQIRFGRDEQEAAEKFAAELARKTDLDVEQKQEVHSQTLKKFVKERLAEGEDLPKALFSILTHYKVRVKTT